MTDLPDRSQDEMIIRLRRRGQLKGGDNSHLHAESWVMVDQYGRQMGASLYDFEDLGHKERNFGTTNVGDIRASTKLAVRLKEAYPDRFVAVNSKHTRPVIAATGKTQMEAVVKALAGDDNSPFGGIWSLGDEMEYPTAGFLNRVFMEGIVAPGYEKGSAELMKAKSKKKGEYANPNNSPTHRNRFILRTGKLTSSDLEALNMTVSGTDVFTQDYEPRFDIRREGFVAAGNGGNRDVSSLDEEVVKSLDFGCTVATNLNSNLVFYLIGDAMAGVGDGCGARHVAARKARSMLEISVYAAMASGDDTLWKRVLYGTPFTREDFEPHITADPKLVVFSDAFYPKPDALIESLGIDRLNPEFANGFYRHNGPKGEEELWLKWVNEDPDYNPALVAKAVLHPGGSMGDHYALSMCEKFGIPLIVTIPPERADEYLELAPEGKKLDFAGRRFFGHQCY